MKAKDVKIGERYVAKVSGKLTMVRIVREANGHCDRNGRCMFGGWHAVNTDTGKEVRIKTAGRLRRPTFNAAKFEAALAADCKLTDETLRRTFEASATPDDAPEAMKELFKI